jgi:hypothetical protein
VSSRSSPRPHPTSARTVSKSDQPQPPPAAGVPHRPGTVKSVSGQDLTLTEGTQDQNKDVTLTIPSDAKIRVAGVDNATLADVKEGMKAVVVTLGGKTVVFAHAPRTAMHP